MAKQNQGKKQLVRDGLSHHLVWLVWLDFTVVEIKAREKRNPEKTQRETGSLDFSPRAFIHANSSSDMTQLC